MLSEREQSFESQLGISKNEPKTGTEWFELLSFAPLKLDELKSERPSLKGVTRDTILSWLEKPSLSLTQVKSILEFAGQFPPLDAAREKHLVVSVLSSQTRTPATDKLSALSSGRGGFKEGPVIDPVQMVDFTGTFEFKDIVSSLRRMNISTVGVIYPTDRAATQFVWGIYWKPPVSSP